MKCLLCNTNLLSEDELKNNYIWYHLINKKDVYLNDLFKPDNIYKRCDICQIEFENSRSKKPHVSFHYEKWEVTEKTDNCQ